MNNIIIPVKLAIRNFLSNKGRTTFSLLGIVIGVTAVILVLSFGMGIKNFIVDQISSFGTDIIGMEVKTPKTKHTSTQNNNFQQISTFKTFKHHTNSQPNQNNTCNLW